MRHRFAGRIVSASPPAKQAHRRPFALEKLADHSGCLFGCSRQFGNYCAHLFHPNSGRNWSIGDRHTSHDLGACGFHTGSFQRDGIGDGSPDRACRTFAELSAGDRRAIGEDYLARVAPQRKTERPLFIDKLPNNWLYIGFIKSILPNARVVDARRHPLSAGIANFRQHFARGQHFAYDLGDLGHYYRDYVRLMAHFAAVLPGAIHRVLYERMMDDSEAEIRALLVALDLPFEPACLTFHTNDRPVRTPSSEQVRSPIYREGTENWQPFAEWLGPLREALGQVVDDYAALS